MNTEKVIELNLDIVVVKGSIQDNTNLIGRKSD